MRLSGSLVAACALTAVVVVLFMLRLQRHGGGCYDDDVGASGGGARVDSRKYRRINADAGPVLFVAVFSAKENKLQRDTIRQTWMANLPAGTMVRFFIGSGQVTDEDLRALRAESNKNKDIAFLPQVVESYTSLSDKLIETLKWIDDLYPDIEFVTKTDDDSFVRVDRILEELRTLDYSDTKGLYWGYFDGRAPVQRHGKWEEHDWFLCDRYLPYALGGGYVISSTVVDFIVNNHHLLTKYKSEDVSMGVWTSSLNIVRQHDQRFDTEWKVG
ncbi:hypothetical protein PTSG_02498 [Salpingoeca rosetta]|uniref:Hexosyltransferase n=1 Tax=Salpingoeca rosetta (strain ATCC 50818 / BSB-021) TaxID=946362 RepID=F2U2D3_SALR5|nr:uncharacterized protein PTSG_02498 [Salpingoeca rosetta]EGD81785.1 hypothetical protein PTSG_02498 [Salpingoeca rosetta]|eukprot:XP_004996989.1 hypothetical protein PTSG_02498 [Salpingoeca rosetta]